MYKYLFMILVFGLLYGCTRDESLKKHRDGTSVITLSINSEKQTPVRAGETDPQSVISNVHFLLFDGPVCVKHVYVEDGYSARIEILSGEYTCYAVTNTGQSDLFSESTTIADLEEDFSYTLPRKDYWETGNPKPEFIMGGKRELYIDTSGRIYEIPVYRIAAKIDVVIQADMGGELGDYNYTFQGISLEGFPMRSTYCPNRGLHPAEGDFKSRELDFTENNGEITLSFYMMENLAGGRLPENEVAAAIKEKYPEIYASGDQKGKRKYAPAHAAYLSVRGHAANQYGDDIYTVHYIYLGHNPSDDYNVGRNEYHTYTVNINGVDELAVDTRVEASLVPPEFSNLDPANSYMVHTSGNYFIPATFMGNRKDKPLSDIMGNIDRETLTAEFLWTDNKESIWLETIEYADHPDQVNYPGEKIIKFRVKGNPELNIEDRGNTVIALYGYEKDDVNRENPVILWSWHIWLIDRPKEVVIGGKTGGTTQNGITYPATDGTLIVLDRDLGALSADPHEKEPWYTYGCHYQMGRKDPFPNAKKDGVWFDYYNSSTYDQRSIGQSNEVIDHLKFNETEPFSEFNGDSRCAFNEKLAPDKTNGFKYVQQGISGLYAARNPMVFATKFLPADTRWTDKQINDAVGDPLYDVTGAKQDYWNRQKTVHDPCPSGWTILGDNASFWNQNENGLDVFTLGGFKDMNGRYIGGFYTRMPGGYDPVWWPAGGVRSIYGKLANQGHTGVYYMLDHINDTHGAHIARFFLAQEIGDSNIGVSFTVQGKEYMGSVTVNGLLAQISVDGTSFGTNQAATVRCVKADQDLGNLNSSATRSGLVKID